MGFWNQTWLGRTLSNPLSLAWGTGPGALISGAKMLGDRATRDRVSAVDASAPDLSGRPAFQGGTDATGRMLPQYQLGNRAYQESPWASMMKRQAGLQRQAESDALAQSGAASAAQARSSLAMRGGLAQGSAERIASQIGREQMMGNQRLAQSNMFSNMDIGAQDYKNQLSNDQFNITNSLGALNNQNNYNMDVWRTQMQQQGVNSLARAQAGQKNGLLGLGFMGL